MRGGSDINFQRGKVHEYFKEEFDIRDTNDVDGHKSVATRMKQTGFTASLRNGPACSHNIDWIYLSSLMTYDKHLPGGPEGPVKLNFPRTYHKVGLSLLRSLALKSPRHH